MAAHERHGCGDWRRSHQLDDEPVQKRVLRKSIRHAREKTTKAHGRIGRLARLVIERSSIDTGSACPRQHDPEAGRMVRVVGPIFETRSLEGVLQKGDRQPVKISGLARERFG
jgi:hypothetical protein